MIRGNPGFNFLLELLSFIEKLCGLGVADDVRDIIIGRIPLPAAELEEGDERRDASSDGEFRGVEAHLMIALAGDTVSGAGNCHFRCLKGRVVCRGEGAVGGESGDAGI